MKKTMLCAVIVIAMAITPLTAFADDVQIDSNGNVKTGVASSGNLEVTGASAEKAIVGQASGTGGAGVYGINSTTGNYGYLGWDSYGIYGSSSTWAGYFQGNARVTGNLTVDGSVSGPNIGDITAVNAGTGLTGGGSGGSVSLSANTNYLQRRVTGTCTASEAVRVVNDDGSVTCVSVSGGAGDITAVFAGTGLSGGGSSGDVTLNVNVPLSLSSAGTNPTITGANTSTGNGIVGNSTGGYGVVGISGASNRDGVHGENTAGTATSYGVRGVVNNSAIGVYGQNVTSGNYGYLGGSSHAGYFSGNVYASNRVGIGTTTPGYTLDVAGPTNLNKGTTGVALRVNDAEALWFSGTYFSWGYGGTANYFERSVGIGTGTPSTRLQILGGSDAGLSNGSGYLVIGTEGGSNIVMDDNEIIARSNGAATKLYLNKDSGNVVVPVIEITGGADLSEQFKISVTKADLLPIPGMVVRIDPENPGSLAVSDKSYDSKVAGIISGAGGINPGMLMGQKGSVADGANPVALTGRVYCWADTANGLIEPGDLLTSSETPGHAMKVTDHVKAQGAIIGKAMTSLKEGRGLVLVLVTLQ